MPFRRAEGREVELRPLTATRRLAALSAYAHHTGPSAVTDRLYALMAVHRALHAPATKAYAEALALLDELGVRGDAERWIAAHAGYMGVWPTAELAEMRGASFKRDLNGKSR